MFVSIGNIFWLFYQGAFQMLQIHIYELFSFEYISIKKAVQSVTMEQAADH